MKKIIVITITCNRLPVTREWIGQLKQKAGYEYRHIVVDNGSTDGTVEWLKEKGFEVIELKENMGIAYAMQKAYELATATDDNIDYFMRYDDDCHVITSGVVRRLVDAMREIGDSMILAPNDIDIIPSYQPTVFGKFEINGHKIRMVTHTGGIFQLIPMRAMEILIKQAQGGELGEIKKDIVRGGLWRLNGMFCGYVDALEVEHKGRGSATKDYKF